MMLMITMTCRSVSVNAAGSAPQTPQLPSMRGPQLLKENLNSSLSRSARGDKTTAGGPPTHSLLFTPNRSVSTPGTSKGKG